MNINNLNKVNEAYNSKRNGIPIRKINTTQHHVQLHRIHTQWITMRLNGFTCCCCWNKLSSPVTISIKLNSYYFKWNIFLFNLCLLNTLLSTGFRNLTRVNIIMNSISTTFCCIIKTIRIFSASLKNICLIISNIRLFLGWSFPM